MISSINYILTCILGNSQQLKLYFGNLTRIKWNILCVGFCFIKWESLFNINANLS